MQKSGPRCKNHQAKAAATKLIPRRGKHHDYYLGADKRHLPTARSTATGTGSQFLDPKLTTLNDIVALAWKQRPTKLDGDDREELITLGVPLEAFNEGIRYLKVETPGTLGVTHSTNLPDDTPIRVIRTKPDTVL